MVDSEVALAKASALLCLVVALAGGSCAPAPQAPARVSLLSGLSAAPQFTSPAEWNYHPRQAALGVTARLAADEGEVFVTQRGERWLHDPKLNHALVAPTLAREPLVQLVDLGSEGWLFVGAGGTTYAAPTALGAFSAVHTPSEPLARVSATPSTLLGVTRKGAVVRSRNRGESWQPLPVEGRATDVALLPSGDGLLLFAPERLSHTTDFGETWTDASPGAFGAVALSAHGQAIGVRGVLGPRRFTPGQPPTWQLEVERGSRPLPTLKAGSRVSASALQAGRAALTAGQYYELESAAESRWNLLVGDELGVLSSRPWPVKAACGQVRLAAWEEHLVAVCAEKAEGIRKLSVWSSADAGRSWQVEPYDLRGDVQRISVLMLKAGRWLISGVCPSAAMDGGCQPRGLFASPVLAPGAAAKPSLVTLTLPLLQDVPLGLAASNDGARVLVIGKRSKGDSLAAYVADGSLSEFHFEEIPDIDAPWDESLSGTPPVLVRSMAAGPDEQFAVSLVERSSGQVSLLVLDRLGRLVTRGRPPPDSVVSGAGSFALAVDPKAGVAWESLDGGVSWQSLGAIPAPLCDPAQARCVPEVWCWVRGCAVADRFSRVGWRGQLEVPGKGQLTPQVEGHPAPNNPLQAPIGCRFDAAAEWQRYPGQRLPGADQAQLGDVAWFSLDADWERGSVGQFEATDASGTAAERIALLDALREPQTAALYAGLQFEGAAALRSVAGRPTEVVWRNLLEGRRTQRVQLPPELRFRTRPTRFATQVLEPDVFSISSGGIFVRAEPGENSAVGYLVKPSGAQKLTPFAWPKLDYPGRAEMVVADGVPLGLSLIDEGAALVRLRDVGGSWQHDAVTLGLLRPKLFDVRQELGLTYRGTAPGFHLMFLDTEHSQAWWFPFAGGVSPLGTAVAVPTQRHLTSQPAVCGAAVRQQTPRSVVPAEQGTQHPVVITHTTEPFSALLTQQAVLFGAPEQACVAVYEARLGAATDGSNPNGSEVKALVVPDPERSSWLFRRAPNSNEFEARRLTCRFEPSLEVPAELTAAP